MELLTQKSEPWAQQISQKIMRELKYLGEKIGKHELFKTFITKQH